MENDQLFTLLEEIKPLPSTFQKALSKELQSVKLPKGHLLVKAASISPFVYFLDEGFAVSYHDKNGKRIVTGFWKEGEIIVSPKSFCEETISEESIQLTMRGKLRSISRKAVKRLFEKFPVANVLAQIIVSQCHHRAEERLVDLHSLDSWELYNKLLGKYEGIESNVSQVLIASYLNITAQSFSRLKADRHKI